MCEIKRKIVIWILLLWGISGKFVFGASSQLVVVSGAPRTLGEIKEGTVIQYVITIHPKAITALQGLQIVDYLPKGTACYNIQNQGKFQKDAQRIQWNIPPGKWTYAHQVSFSVKVTKDAPSAIENAAWYGPLDASVNDLTMSNVISYPVTQIHHKKTSKKKKSPKINARWVRIHEIAVNLLILATCVFLGIVWSIYWTIWRPRWPHLTLTNRKKRKKGRKDNETTKKNSKIPWH